MATHDFDEEARKIFRFLNLSETGESDSKTGRRLLGGRVYNELDPVWQHPESGARVFIGGVAAAGKRKTLANNNISCIINCQELSSENYFEDDASLQYFRFPISLWMSRGNGNMESDEGVLAYFDRVFSVIDAATAKGQSVLIHCLAGAHRAGTTGVAFLMHVTGLRAADALAVAKTCRAAVNPIGHLLLLLNRFDEAVARKRLSADSFLRDQGFSLLEMSDNACWGLEAELGRCVETSSESASTTSSPRKSTGSSFDSNLEEQMRFESSSPRKLRPRPVQLLTRTKTPPKSVSKPKSSRKPKSKSLDSAAADYKFFGGCPFMNSLQSTNSNMEIDPKANCASIADQYFHPMKNPISNTMPRSSFEVFRVNESEAQSNDNFSAYSSGTGSIADQYLNPFRDNAHLPTTRTTLGSLELPRGHLRRISEVSEGPFLF